MLRTVEAPPGPSRLVPLPPPALLTPAGPEAAIGDSALPESVGFCSRIRVTSVCGVLPVRRPAQADRLCPRPILSWFLLLPPHPRTTACPPFRPRGSSCNVLASFRAFRNLLAISFALDVNSSSRLLVGARTRMRTSGALCLALAQVSGMPARTSHLPRRALSSATTVAEGPQSRSRKVSQPDDAAGHLPRQRSVKQIRSSSYNQRL